MFNNFAPPLEIRAVFEMIYINMIEPDRSQMIYINMIEPDRSQMIYINMIEPDRSQMTI